MAMKDSKLAQHPQRLGTSLKAPPIGDYMGPQQLAYFKQKLLDWRSSLLDEVDATLAELRHDSHHEVGDEADRATREAAQTLELRTRDRYRKLLSKIDAALDRIEDGTYGWCEDTGEPIGLARLEARPVTTLCVEAQERRELQERLTGVSHGRN
jgi:DnaK suppressor protein